jgi:integrase
MQVTWERFQAEALATWAPPMRAPATWRAMRQVLTEVGQMGCQTTDGLTPELLSRWIQSHPSRSPARIRSLLRSLQPAMKFAIVSGWLPADRNPFLFRSAARWMPGRDLPRVKRFLTAHEVAAILGRADTEVATGAWQAGRLQALVYLAAYTGMRRGELLWLSVRDVDLTARTISITPKPGWSPKTAASIATLPILEPLERVLSLWLPRTGCQWVIPGYRSGKPWTGGPPGQKALDCVAALGRRAGVPAVTLISFRRTIATLASGWGLGPLAVQALLRHTTVTTQEWYRQPDLEGLRAAAEKIRYG